MITFLTELMDGFFIRIGFEKRELEASYYRGQLYAGMIYMLGLASAFLLMGVLS